VHPSTFCPVRVTHSTFFFVLLTWQKNPRLADFYASHCVYGDNKTKRYRKSRDLEEKPVIVGPGCGWVGTREAQAEDIYTTDWLLFSRGGGGRTEYTCRIVYSSVWLCPSDSVVRQRGLYIIPTACELCLCASITIFFSASISIPLLVTR
jgi:hypothetical protein